MKKNKVKVYISYALLVLNTLNNLFVFADSANEFDTDIGDGKVIVSEDKPGFELDSVIDEYVEDKNMYIIDNNAPIIEGSVFYKEDGNAIINIEFSDDDSGINQLFLPDGNVIKFNNIKYQKFEWNVQMSGEYIFKVVDGADNSSDVLVNVDIVKNNSGDEVEQDNAIVLIKDVELEDEVQQNQKVDKENYLKSKSIIFQDDKLRVAICKALNKDVDYQLTENDVKELKSLNINSLSINSLAGLEYATNLTSLYASNNNIVDLTPIENITGLKTLNLDGNKISDITALGKLLGLRVIFLRSNNVVDISPLVNLNNLFEAYLSDNKISDIEPILNNKELCVLELDNNMITSIEGVSYLPNIEELSLAGNNISDIEEISKLPLLNYLCLSNNNINNVAPIMSNNSIASLFLDNNKIETIGGIEALTNLTSLNISNNLVKDISPVGNLVKLKILIAKNNLIYDVESIKNKVYLDLAMTENLIDSSDNDNKAFLNKYNKHPNNVRQYKILFEEDKSRSVSKNIYVKKVLTDYNGYEEEMELDINDIDINFDCKDVTFNKNKSGIIEFDSTSSEDVEVNLSYKGIASQTASKSIVLKGNNGCNGDCGNGECDGTCESSKVYFKDFNLEKVIRTAIDKPLGQLYKKDLLKLTNLDASNSNIEFLDGLENCTNIENLNLSNNIIQDITKVSYLFKLKELDISRNHITKILDLSSLSNLNFLNLGFNFIDARLSSDARNKVEVMRSNNPDLIVMFAENETYQYFLKNETDNTATLSINEKYYPVASVYKTQNGLSFEKEFIPEFKDFKYTINDTQVVGVGLDNLIVGNRGGISGVKISYKGIPNNGSYDIQVEVKCATPTIILNTDAKNDSWCNNDVTLSVKFSGGDLYFNANDNEYKMVASDGAGDYTLMVSDSPMTKYSFKVINKDSGQISTVESIRFGVDKVAPNIPTIVQTEKGFNIVNNGDDNSGVKLLQYNINGGTYNTYLSEIDLLASREQLIIWTKKIYDLDYSEYTINSWNSMIVVLNKTNKVLHNSNSTDIEIENAYKELLTAYLGLRYSPVATDITQYILPDAVTPLVFKISCKSIDEALNESSTSSKDVTFSFISTTLSLDAKVSFADESLEREIRRMLNKSSGDILRRDLSGIYGEFNAVGCNINDITGLRYCTNITEIYLDDNNIENIEELAFLKKLRIVSIKHNNISDIAPVFRLSNLAQLNIEGNNIKEEDIEKLNNTIKVDIINKDEVTDKEEVTDKDVIIDKNNIINKNDNVRGEGDLENDNKVNKEYTIYIFLMSLVSAAGIISILSIKRRKYK